jgi:hypothetical protein
MADDRSAGLLGPDDEDAGLLILDLINRQDRYVARRTCSTKRRELGARTATLAWPARQLQP